MDRLDQIVSLLEKNEIALEEAIGLFEEGLNLVQDLDTQLQGYENKVRS
ncbi:MAG: exodeoxyribonuclease VII small subunit [Holdemania massiliensis]